MSSVLTYANSSRQCFCQIRLDSGERVLISMAASPSPSIKILKMGFLGFIPVGTVWKFTDVMAGGPISYLEKLVQMFRVDGTPMHLPLDSIRDFVLKCESIDHLKRELETRYAA